MELAHASYKFQQQCNRTQAILEAYISQMPCEMDENCAGIDIVEIDPNVTDNVPSEIDNEDELSEAFLNSGSSTCKDRQSLECTVVNNESFNFNENKTVSQDILVACENTDNCENVIFIKQESHTAVLETVKDATSEDHNTLRGKLTLKKIQSNITTDNNTETKKGKPRLNFNYYVKETINGEKVNHYLLIRDNILFM